MLAIAKTDDWLAKPTAALGDFSTYFYGYFLAFLLVGVGLYFTARMYGIQFRLFRHMVASLTNSRDGQGGGISSFQAFTIGLASRVGTGNIIGVALAIDHGWSGRRVLDVGSGPGGYGYRIRGGNLGADV